MTVKEFKEKLNEFDDDLIIQVILTDVEPYELLSEVDERGCVSIYSEEGRYFDFHLGNLGKLIIEGEGF